MGKNGERVYVYGVAAEHNNFRDYICVPVHFLEEFITRK